LESPGFHSFDKIADISGIQYFYCFPAHNKKSVQTQEDMLNFVSHFPEIGNWSFVFHAKGYTFSHLMPLSVALEMGKLVERNHLEGLQKIYIVQGTWFMRFVVICILPFLQKEMRSKFVLLDGPLLEVITSLRKEGIPLANLQTLRNRFDEN
jgi:hypothetical protein